METHVATRKDHRCDECGKRIPKGSRYFTREAGEGWHKEHTNCLDFESEEDLPAGYNQNRRTVNPNPKRVNR